MKTKGNIKRNFSRRAQEKIASAPGDAGRSVAAFAPPF